MATSGRNATEPFLNGNNLLVFVWPVHRLFSDAESVL